MKRTCQALQTSAVAQERITQGAADEMGRVRRDVATLVVAVQREIQPQQVLEVLVLLAALAQHGRKVVRPVLFEIDFRREGTAAPVRVVVDLGGYGGQLGQQADGVVKGGLPVVGLVEALLVGLCELGGIVQGGDGDGELGHGVEVLGEVVEHLVDKGGQLGLLGQLSREDANLACGGDLSGEEQPEHGLGQHLGAGLALGQLLLAVLDGAAVEADALVGIEDGALPDHGLEPAHATEGVLDLDLTNDGGAVCLDLFQELSLGGNDLLERGFQIWLGG